MFRKLGIFVSISSLAAMVLVGHQAYSSNWSNSLQSEMPQAYIDRAVYTIDPTPAVQSFEQFEKPNRPRARPSRSWNTADLECMAMNIFFEAGIETVDGKIAVGRVTLNRVHDARYPSTVCGVVTQSRDDSNGNPIRNRCQFSWYCDGKPDDVPYDSRNYQESLMVAMDILDGNYDGFVEYATHYHANYVKPSWRTSLTKVSRVDTHIFYRWD